MLVCTSVVEVGVDVPNATLMTIEGGAAVRPGAASPVAGPDQPRQVSRLLLRVRRAAERRGAAAAEGVCRDHRRLPTGGDGFSAARAGRPVRHEAARPAAAADRRPARATRPLLEEARRDARALVAADPDLAAAEHALLRRMMLARYGKALELGDVG